MKKFCFICFLFICVSVFAIPVETAHCDFRRAPEQSTEDEPYTITQDKNGWKISFSKPGRYDINLPYSDRQRITPLATSLYAKTITGKAYCKLKFLSKRGKWFVTQGKWIAKKRIPFELDGMERTQTWRLRILQVDAVAGTEILLENIMLTEERPAVEALRFSVDADGLLMPVFNDESLKRMKIAVHNGTGEAIERNVNFSFTGLGGKQFSFERKISLPAYTRTAFELPVKPPHYGVWYGDAESDGSRLMFGYVPENGLKTSANPEFEFAVDNHWINPAVIEAMRYTGIRAIRTIVGWERVQPYSANHWNFKVFENRLNTLEKAGIKMRETLVFTPRWAPESNPDKVTFPRNRKPKMKAWENYVRAMVKRYGKRVEFFELWNEPDLKGFFKYPVKDYIELCRRAREIAKEVEPECKFSSGGFATLSPGHPNKPGKFHETVLRDAKDTFDIHSYHEHGYFPHYQQMVDGYFLPLRKKHNITAPWLASETAMHSAKGLDREQADCLFKKLLFTWARGGFSYTWYGLCNNGYDLNYSEDNFGMFDKYMNPKYVFGTYAALIRVYNQARFSGQLSTEGAPWFFAFRTPDVMLLANWSALPDSGKKIYAVHAPQGRKAELLDLDGNASPLPFADETALFPVEPEGRTLRVEGAKSLNKAELVAEVILPPAVFPGKTTEGTLYLNNPWKKKINIVLNAEDAGLEGLPKHIELAAGAKNKLLFRMFCKNADKKELALNLQFAGMPEVKVTAPLKFAKLSPDASFSKRKPDFVLKNYSQVEGNFEFDPAKTAGLWKGFNDLSVELWVGQRKGNFELLAKVRDDKHCTAKDNVQLWTGDSIQFNLGFFGQKGFFELGAGIGKDGKAHAGCWIVPAGYSTEEVRKAVKAQISRSGVHTVYRISVPLSALGVDAEELKRGFRFNFLANDNDDGKSRKCFIRLAPGIGSSQSIEHAPMLICNEQ